MWNMLVTKVFHNIRAGMLARFEICVGKLAGGNAACMIANTTYFL